jgi:hypothetical protein
VDNLRIGASYYHDYLPNNLSGAHSGHNASTDHHTGEIYNGPLTFDLACFSLAYFGNKFELLSESSLNLTRTDSLGQANNYSSFLYAGFRIKERHVPYVVLDYIEIDKDDLHTYEFKTAKLGVGYKHEFNHLICLKTQVEYQFYTHNLDDHHLHNKLGVRIQLAYGF